MSDKLFNWIGGKKWLAKDLILTLDNFKDKNIENYVEPFVGGLGSFLFTLDKLKSLGIKNFYLNDINNTIINTYKFIKEDYLNVYNHYIKIENEYKDKIPEKAFSLHKKRDKEEIKELLIPARDFYNTVKVRFNESKEKNDIESVVCFLFLAEHCFNGVYRENQKGEFNTPYNWETGVPNLDNKKNTLKNYSVLFNSHNIEFFNMDCFEFLYLFKDKLSTVIYCDPPYLNEDIGENKYNRNHFGIKEQLKLIEYYKEIEYCIFSNHFLPLFEDFCINNLFNFNIYYRNNIMSSKNATRGDKVAEILAYKI